MRIRDANAADFGQILELNEASVHYLSPLTMDGLVRLHALSNWHRVVDIEGGVAAFLLTLPEGAAYDSVNYRWFADRYARFLYVDRVVVAEARQGLGLGRALYDDLFSYGHAQGVSRITAEFDVEPPNEASRRFHASFGFVEVGSQSIRDGKKRVSLQVAELTVP
jgi:predicted GNAT superfamily acetyltransferase